MSNFWDKNKGSITSGLVSAGKYGVKGTKYVAKTGYQVGKNQYNAHKGTKQNGNDQSNTSPTNEAQNLESLHDPNLFMAPPLRPGQKQYAGKGVTVDGEENAQNNPQQYQQSLYQINQQNQQNQQNQMIQPNQMNQLNQQNQMNELNQPNGQFSGYHTQISDPPVRALPSIPPRQDLTSSSTQQYYPSAMHSNAIMGQNQQSLPEASATIDDSTRQNSNGRLRKSATPILEVKPFNKEQWEEEKKTKQIVFNEVDTASFAPPPCHRDRSSSNSRNQSPSISSSSKVHSPASYHKPSLTTPKNITHIETTCTPIQLTDNTEEKETNQKETEDKPAVVGTYQEPQISFAPPPRAFNSGNSKLNQTLSNTPLEIVTNSAPKPLLPSRIPTSSEISNNPSLSPIKNTSNQSEGRNNTELQQNEINKYENQTEAGNNQPLETKIVGAYQEPAMNFAPPPRPHRSGTNSTSSLTNKPLRNTSPNTSKPLLPSRTTTTESFSYNKLSHSESIQEADNKSEPIAVLPTVHKHEKSQSSDQPLRAAVVGTYEEPKTNFAPPPIPFGSKTRPIGTSTTNSASATISSSFIPSLPTRSDTNSSLPEKSTQTVNSTNPYQTQERKYINNQTFITVVPDFKKSNNNFQSSPSRFKNLEDDVQKTKKTNLHHSNLSAPPPIPQKKFNPLKKDFFEKSNENNIYTDKGKFEEQNVFSNQGFSGKFSASSGDDSKIEFNKRGTRFNSSPFLKDLQSSISTLHLDEDEKKNHNTCKATIKQKDPPPIVKPKPKLLHQLQPMEKKSHLPPKVKPKPKDLSNVATSKLSRESTTQIIEPKIDLMSKNTSSLDTEKSEAINKRTLPPVVKRKPPNIPVKKNSQMLSLDSQNGYKRGKMPLPHELGEEGSMDSSSHNNQDDETNPFAIYKKEVVPASNNRIQRS